MAYKDSERQKEYQRLWQREQRVKRRNRVVDLLGRKCIDCGNSDIRVLQIDHKIPVLRNREGYNKRLDSGARLTDRIANGTLDINDFELRCANCHQIKNYALRVKLKNYKEGEYISYKDMRKTG